MSPEPSAGPPSAWLMAILEPSRNRGSVTRLAAIAILICVAGVTVPLAMLHAASIEAPGNASVEADSKIRREKAAKVKQLAELEASGGKMREEGKLAVDVRISGVDGHPIDQYSAVTVWERAEASDVAPRDYTSTDPRDGAIWRRVSGSNPGESGPTRNGKDRFEHLAPGPYQVDASARTGAYGYPDYRLEKPIAIEVRDGKPNDFVLVLQAQPLDEAEAQKRWPWAVEGVVTDQDGQPLEGVEIRAACGWGTLRSTMPAISDSRGRYRLRFGPGMMIKNEETGQWGAGVQAATISARKPGYAEKNLGRQGGLLMADRMPNHESDWDREKIILPGKPYRVDFTMLPGAAIQGRLIDEKGEPLAEKRIYLNGDELAPSSSVSASATTDVEGRFQFAGVAPGFAWWFELSDAKDFALPRTQPITLRQGEDYQLVLQVASQLGAGKMLRIASITDSQGRDIRDQAMGDDPRARPFVDAETAAKAREILDRVAEANWYWFGGPSDDIKSFSYTFQLAGEEPRNISYEDPSSHTSLCPQSTGYFW
jgi:protocatechuate 3,4-dioxygenase beta subunit